MTATDFLERILNTPDLKGALRRETTIEFASEDVISDLRPFSNCSSKWVIVTVSLDNLWFLCARRLREHFTSVASVMVDRGVRVSSARFHEINTYGKSSQIQVSITYEVWFTEEFPQFYFRDPERGSISQGQKLNRTVYHLHRLLGLCPSQQSRNRKIG
jgi:hypothetical protein